MRYNLRYVAKIRSFVIVIHANSTQKANSLRLASSTDSRTSTILKVKVSKVCGFVKTQEVLRLLSLSR